VFGQYRTRFNIKVYSKFFAFSIVSRERATERIPWSILGWSDGRPSFRYGNEFGAGARTKAPANGFTVRSVGGSLLEEEFKWAGVFVGATGEGLLERLGASE